MPDIRPARPEDLPLLPGLERAAGEPFRAAGMADVADDDPPAAAELEGFRRDGRAWVAEDGGRPVGYLLAEVVDGEAHIAQVSVHPDRRGERIGRGLIDAAEAWARERGLPALTLTTFAQVPWNAPYYRRLGFRDVPDAELAPGLRAVRAAEAARGLDRWPRLAMRRPVRRQEDGGARTPR